MHVTGPLRLRVHQGLAGSGGDRDVGAAGEVQHAQRVLGRLRQLDVAVHRGDQAQVDLGAGQGQQDGQRVVDAGVGVDHQGDGCGHRGILAAGRRHAAQAGRRPGMTVPPFLQFPRSECTSCRHVPGPKNGSPTRPEMVHNGSVTRPSANVANGRERGPRCLPFSLSATPSPVADTTSGRRHEQRSSGPPQRAWPPTRPPWRPSAAWLASSTTWSARGRTGAPAHHAPSPASYRPAGARTGGVRTVPLRSVQPAPMARRIPGAAPATPAVPLPAPAVSPHRDPLGRTLGRRSRRASTWPGARTPCPPGCRAAARRTDGTPPVGSAAAPGAPDRPVGRRPGRRVPRLGRPRAAPDAKRAADRPVVLREMPSTPMIQPVASSPAAALSLPDPASTGSRGMPPVPRGAVAVPGVRPRGCLNAPGPPAGRRKHGRPVWQPA